MSRRDEPSELEPWECSQDAFSGYAWFYTNETDVTYEAHA
jgi:hypothetical protein